MPSTDLEILKRRLAVQYLPLDQIHLDPENARQHSKAQIRQIARSIETFGFNVPGVVDEAGKLLVGNGRYLACQLLGLQEMPAVRLSNLTPEQARAFAIADNKLTENSKWNDEILAEQLKTLSVLDLDFSLDVTGFTMGEIDVLIEGLDVGEEADPDDVTPEAATEAVSRQGDLWNLGSHRIFCGNALNEADYARLMGGQPAAMAFTDAPYNRRPEDITGKGRTRHRPFDMGIGEFSEAEFVAFLGRVMRNMVRNSAKGAVHFHFMDWQHSAQLQAAAKDIYDALLSICVWAKPSGGMGGLYRSSHEFVHVYRAGPERHTDNVKLGKYGRNRTNTWTGYGGPAALRASEDGDLIGQHPTPKPIRLVADAILDVSARRDIVLDPFLGTGATLLACERTGRRCRGIEIDPIYVDLSIRRWQRLTGEVACREDGKFFDEIAAKVQP